MAAATNAATNFSMIPKGLTGKGSEVATSDHVFWALLTGLTVDSGFLLLKFL